MPTVIKNGQVITDGNISSVDIHWEHNLAPSITVEHA